MITKELFNLRYKVSGLCIDHICDQLELITMGIIPGVHMVVSGIENFDHAIMINFLNGSIEGQLRIDRIKQRFEVCIENDCAWGSGKETFVPVCGDWHTVINYLFAVVMDTAGMNLFATYRPRS